jgi:hypothetical protein
MTPEIRHIRDTRRARERHIPLERLPVVVVDTKIKYKKRVRGK